MAVLPPWRIQSRGGAIGRSVLMDLRHTTHIRTNHESIHNIVSTEAILRRLPSGRGRAHLRTHAQSDSMMFFFALSAEHQCTLVRRLHYSLTHNECGPLLIDCPNARHCQQSFTSLTCLLYHMPRWFGLQYASSLRRHGYFFRINQRRILMHQSLKKLGEVDILVVDTIVTE
jgi:hypothetical protein